MVILDTSLIINHLRQPHTQSHLLRMAHAHPKEIFCLSIISLQELYGGTSTRDQHKEHSLLATIGPLKILPYTYEIAQKAGEITRDTQKIITFADSSIAATALIHHYPLATLNRKDFSAIAHLELFPLSS